MIKTVVGLKQYLGKQNIMFFGSAFADESGFHYALLALICCYISTSRPRSELWGICYLHPDCAWPLPFHTMLCTRTMLSRLCSQSAYLLLQRRLEMSVKIAYVVFVCVCIMICNDIYFIWIQ